MSQTSNSTSAFKPSLLSQFAVSSPTGDMNYDDSADIAFQRHLNFQSACTLKALSPIQEIVAFEQIQGMSDTDSAKLCRELILSCRKHSSAACIALEIPEESTDWARSYFATHIAMQMAKIWPKARNKALEVDWSIALSEIAVPHLKSNVPPSWKNTPLEVSITATVLTAVQTVMSEYEVFNLLHKDRELIQEWVGNLILDTALTTAADLAVEFSFSNDAEASTAQSLMKNGGNILASQWGSFSRKTLQILKDHPASAPAKDIKDNGFPLSEIEVAFKQQMRSLAMLSSKTIQQLRASASAAASFSPEN